MPRINDELRERIISSNEIVNFIGGYVHLKKAGSNYQGLCPFHNEKSPSFSVSPNKQFFHCFGCHKSGNVITFAMEYLNMSYMDAMEMLADRAGIELPQNDTGYNSVMTEEEREAYRRKRDALRQEKRRQTEAFYAINKEAAIFYYKKLYSKDGEKALAYFRDRGLTDETIKHFGLGYAGINEKELYLHLSSKGFSDEDLNESGLFTRSEKGFTDKFWNRVMFPIMDQANRVVAFGGRVMGDGKPKYLNSQEKQELFEKGKMLYAWNYASKADKKRPIILCEGYMDTISMHQAGFTTAVASLGTAFTENHARMIAGARSNVYESEREGKPKEPVRVILTYDSDEAGVKASLRAIPMLRAAGIHPLILNLKPYKDPDEFIKKQGGEAFETRIKNAQNGFLFECDRQRDKFNLTDPGERAEFTDNIARMLATTFEDSHTMEEYAREIADSYGMNPRALIEKAISYGDQRLKREEEKKQTEQEGQITGNKNTAEEKKIMKAEKVSSSELRDQKLLLVNFLEKPDYIGLVKEYIGPSDFETEAYAVVAEQIFNCYEKGISVNRDALLGEFTERETQQLVASLFGFSLEREDSADTQETAFLAKELSLSMIPEAEREKNLKQVVKKVRLASIARKLQKAMENNDFKALQKLSVLKQEVNRW